MTVEGEDEDEEEVQERKGDSGNRGKIEQEEFLLLPREVIQTSRVPFSFCAGPSHVV